MLVFLKKTITFFLILFAYIIAMYLLNLAVIIKAKPAGWKNCHILIAGDSHTQRAFNPKFFNSSINISQDAEPYFLTYWKLKKYFSQNTADTLLIGFSYHNLSSFEDKKLIDKYWSDEMFKRIYSLNTPLLPRNMEVDKKAFYETRFKYMCLYPRFQPFDFSGGYSNTTYSNLSGIDEVIRRHYTYENAETDISASSLLYLDSIISLCNQKRVKIIVVTTPMHTSYLKQIPEKFIYGYEIEKNKLRTKGIDVLNCGNENYADNLYLNPDHLNKTGAEIFTKEIVYILNHKFYSVGLKQNYK